MGLGGRGVVAAPYAKRDGCNLLGGVEWGVAVKRDGQSVWIGGMAARVGVFREFGKL